MSIKVALSKLRSAQICHPNAVQFLIDEAITAILALRPTAVPMNQDEVIAAIKSANISSSTTFWSIFEAGIRAAEAHQGITAQAKKETT